MNERENFWEICLVFVIVMMMVHGERVMGQDMGNLKVRSRVISLSTIILCCSCLRKTSIRSRKYVCNILYKHSFDILFRFFFPPRTRIL